MSHNPSHFYPVKLTDDITLRSFKAADAEKFLAFINANRPYLERFDDFMKQQQSLQDAKHTTSFIEQLYAEGKTLSCTIWEGDAIIGYFICGIDWTAKTVQPGYAIAEDHQGRGIITRTARIILDYAFNQLGMESAWLTCWTTNTSSIRLAEKLGFQRQPGILPIDEEFSHEQYKYVLQKPAA